MEAKSTSIAAVPLYLYSHNYIASVFIAAPTAKYGPYKDKLLITGDTLLYYNFTKSIKL